MGELYHASRFDTAWTLSSHLNFLKREDVVPINIFWDWSGAASLIRNCCWNKVFLMGEDGGAATCMKEEESWIIVCASRPFYESGHRLSCIGVIKHEAFCLSTQ